MGSVNRPRVPHHYFLSEWSKFLMGHYTASPEAMLKLLNNDKESKWESERVTLIVISWLSLCPEAARKYDVKWWCQRMKVHACWYICLIARCFHFADKNIFLLSWHDYDSFCVPSITHIRIIHIDHYHHQWTTHQ